MPARAVFGDGRASADRSKNRPSQLVDELHSRTHTSAHWGKSQRRSSRERDSRRNNVGIGRVRKRALSLRTFAIGFKPESWISGLAPSRSGRKDHSTVAAAGADRDQRPL